VLRTGATASPAEGTSWLRIVLACSLAVALLLQVRLWLSDDGMPEVWRLENEIARQQQENATLQARNRGLIAEVQDLKDGTAAIEERARTDLGMIGKNETFVEVVPAPDGERPGRANSRISAAQPAAK
jgi:cell division protein FtsB